MGLARRTQAGNEGPGEVRETLSEARGTHAVMGTWHRKTWEKRQVDGNRGGNRR